MDSGYENTEEIRSPAFWLSAFVFIASLAGGLSCAPLPFAGIPPWHFAFSGISSAILIALISLATCDADTPASECRKYELSRFVTLYGSVLSTVLCLVGWLLLADHYLATDRLAYNSLSSLQIFGALALVVATLAVAYRVAKQFEHRYFTSWADPNPHVTGGPLTWTDIRDLLSDLIGMAKKGMLETDEDGNVWCERLPDRDPVATSLKPRRYHALTQIPKILFQLFTIAIFIYLAERIVITPSMISGVLRANDLTATLAIIGGLSAIAVAAYQLKGKVKADNRQKWIDEVREILSEISLYDDADFHTKRGRKTHKQRMKLEYLLNPSELEHRVLVTLVRRKLGLCIPYLDQRIFEELTLTDWGKANEWEDDRKDTHFQYAPLSNYQNEILISMIVRVAQVIIKREWERVKDAR